MIARFRGNDRRDHVDIRSCRSQEGIEVIDDTVDIYTDMRFTEDLDGLIDLVVVQDLVGTLMVEMEAYDLLAVAVGRHDKEVGADRSRKDVGIRLEGEAVKDAAALVDPLKAAYAGCFAQENTGGTPPLEPPAGGNKTYTRDQLRQMSPAEINRNWDAIKGNLASLK